MAKGIKTKDMVYLAVLSAVAYVTLFFIYFPIMPNADFLIFEIKNVVLVIGGFLFGPLAALAMTITVAFLEMVTISRDGLVGMLMNVISSAAFVCTAAAIYRRKRNLTGAVLGLAAGCLMATAVMILWNYIVTPVYRGVPRAVVANMLVPVFLPFNLIKGVLNAAIAMILYKPTAALLKRTYGKREGDSEDGKKVRLHAGVLLVSLFTILSAVLVILILQGKV
jgi:riboflavin transporter FmnP